MKKKKHKREWFFFLLPTGYRQRTRGRKTLWKQLRKACMHKTNVRAKTIKVLQRTKIYPMRGHNKTSTVSYDYHLHVQNPFQGWSRMISHTVVPRPIPRSKNLITWQSHSFILVHCSLLSFTNWLFCQKLLQSVVNLTVRLISSQKHKNTITQQLIVKFIYFSKQLFPVGFY